VRGGGGGVSQRGGRRCQEGVKVIQVKAQVGVFGIGRRLQCVGKTLLYSRYAWPDAAVSGLNTGKYR